MKKSVIITLSVIFVFLIIILSGGFYFIWLMDRQSEKTEILMEQAKSLDKTDEVKNALVSLVDEYDQYVDNIVDSVRSDERRKMAIKMEKLLQSYQLEVSCEEIKKEYDSIKTVNDSLTTKLARIDTRYVE